MDEQMQQLLVSLVLAAMQGNQEATQQIQQIAQAALQGNQQAVLLYQIIQLIAELLLQTAQLSAPSQSQEVDLSQAQLARLGAKLNYINYLNGVCPDGYEMRMFKKGGAVCKKCVAKQKKMEQGGEAPSDSVDAFKCGRKINKKACGGSVKKKVKKGDGGLKAMTMNTSDYRGGSHIKYPNLLNPAIIKERINPHYYTTGNISGFYPQNTNMRLNRNLINGDSTIYVTTPRGTVESTKGVDTDFPKYRDMWERAKSETKKK